MNKYLAMAAIAFVVIVFEVGFITATNEPTEVYSPQEVSTPSKQIIISSDSFSTSSIGYSDASPGKEFLVITVTIQNKGYDYINTNPNRFYVKANNVIYDYDSASFGLDGEKWALNSGTKMYDYDTVTTTLPSVDVLDGGTVTGSLAFEIPANTKQFRFGYSHPTKDYNIKYILID